MISDVQLPDGNWKQIIMTGRGGRIMRLLSPDRKTILDQQTRSFAKEEQGKSVYANADFWNPETGEAKQNRGIRPQQPPPIQQLQKMKPMAEKMMSEKRMPDGRWYQVWETAKGKQIKILSPDKSQVVHQYAPATASRKNFRKAIKEKIHMHDEVSPPVENVSPQPIALPDFSMMTLSKLASLIKRDWKNVNFGAKPYLDAMLTLNAITDDYFQDSGASIVAYFLSNATQYKGDLARGIKKELNRRLKSYYKR